MVGWAVAFGLVVRQHTMEEHVAEEVLTSSHGGREAQRERERRGGVPISPSRAGPQGPNFLPLGPTFQKTPPLPKSTMGWDQAFNTRVFGDIADPNYK